MVKDEYGGGTEKNGSKSELYCSHCYKKGKFIQRHITAEDMQELVISKLQDMKIPRFIGKFFARNIPNLARWNKEN